MDKVGALPPLPPAPGLRDHVPGGRRGGPGPRGAERDERQGAGGVGGADLPSTSSAASELVDTDVTLAVCAGRRRAVPAWKATPRGDLTPSRASVLCVPPALPLPPPHPLLTSPTRHSQKPLPPGVPRLLGDTRTWAPAECRPTLSPEPTCTPDFGTSRVTRGPSRSPPAGAEALSVPSRVPTPCSLRCRPTPKAKPPPVGPGGPSSFHV